MAVKVVTDSSSDIPPDIARELDITVVPLYIRFDSNTYRDGVDISPDQFYDRLTRSKTLPSTSIPSPGDFAETYRSIANEHDSILSIHLSPRYSGAINAAMAAKDYMTNHCKVEVVNSGTVSMGCGFTVIAAARRAREVANLRVVMRTVENTIMRTHILGMITDIDYLLNGKRLSLPWTHVFLGQLGSIIRCKLVGEIYEAGRVRGRGMYLREKKALERLQECVLEYPSVEEIAVLHAMKPDWAQAIAGRMTAEFPNIPVRVSRLSGATGVHGGPGAMAVAFITGTEGGKSVPGPV